MSKSHLKLVAPTTILRTVMPRRRPNRVYREREYLTPQEVEALMTAARRNRWGHRDSSMILLCYRHGLRAGEACGLKWEAIDFGRATLHVNRAKGGDPSVHPISETELRALRRLKRESPESPFVFVSERGSPFSVSGFRRLIERAGVEAGFPFRAHPHMLRHACGYKLANEGVDTRSLQAYLGHRNIAHTTRYATLRTDRFKGVWKD
jgi:integrase